MAQTAVASRTIDEIVEHIITHGGPDLERMAHPEIKMVKYEDLDRALLILHSRRQLPDLTAFHFKNVRNIWNQNDVKNYPLAREMTGLLMDELLQEYGSYMGIVGNITFHAFTEKELIYLTREGVIRYNLGSMLVSVYDNSPSEAVTDYFKNHPDKIVRKEFQGLKPYHFGMTPIGYWKSPDGQKEARAIIGQTLNPILEECGGNWIEVVKRIRDDYFNGKEVYFENKFGRIAINVQSVIACAYDGGSHVKSILDFLENNDDIDLRKEFAGLRPYHFVHSTHGIWDGKDNNPYAIELTDLVLKDVAKERGIRLSEAVQDIRAGDFDRTLKFTNSFGTIEFSGDKAFKNPHMYDGSLTRAISSWKKQNTGERI